jgi:hypothetical protein
MAGKMQSYALALRESGSAFGSEGFALRKRLLEGCKSVPLVKGKALIAYTESLMFLRVYQSDQRLHGLIEREMNRVVAFLRDRKGNENGENDGLPFQPVRTRFSLDFLNWLQSRNDVSVRITSINETNATLNDLLRLTLPSAERELTSAGHVQDGILEALGIIEKNKLEFILDQFSALSARRDVADYLFDALDIQVEVLPKRKEVSKLFNRLSFVDEFVHADIQRKFDHIELLNRPLPDALSLTDEQQSEATRVIRDAMLLNARETDPATYLDQDSLRIFQLERGISIAFFGMTGMRQLAFESYIGYTLFKNGYPVSYGGGWVFGKRSLFGINIFDAFRGGESGYIMCQLLRTYRQAFGIDYFEVEPYQYGADNPDGIKSGAFWFYYRYGFRPLDKSLNKLASDEASKIATRKGYRSSENTLIRFTESNIALEISRPQRMTVALISERITKMIRSQFKGDRANAVETCVMDFAAACGGISHYRNEQIRVLEEVALFARAFNVSNNDLLMLLSDMIHAKVEDPYEYQRIWLTFFDVFEPSRK